MNVASLELSKELYRISNGSWDDTFLVWQNRSDDGGKTVHYALITHSDNEHYDYPAYDLGYLLRKLPASIPSKEYVGEFAKLWTRKDDYPEDEVKSPTVYFAWYFVTGKVDGVSDYGESADTPEDAACKLAIELFKQGVLTKEKQR